MDAAPPPSSYVYSGPTFAIQSMKPSYFQIMGSAEGFLVRINAEDGSLTFGPNYTPDAAAKVFWQSISDEYKKMLRWKAEHPEAQ